MVYSQPNFKKVKEMAVIQKIRNRSGLLIAVIGGAMVLFVGSDLLNSNGQFFSRQEYNVGEINGTTITLKQFEQRVQDVVGDQSVGSNEMELYRNQTWNLFLQDYLIKTEYDALGVDIVDDELWDEIKNNRDGILSAYFTDRNTGQIYEAFRDERGGLNMQMAILQLKQLVKDEEAKKNWSVIERSIREQLMSGKYTGLLKRGLTATDFQATERSKNNNDQIVVSWAGMSYGQVKDEDISYSESDISAWYNKHKSEDQFQQDEDMRSAKVVVFDVVPSANDIQTAKNEMAALKDGFAKSENDTLFIIQNTDNQYSAFASYGRFELPLDIDSLVFNAEDGAVVGPYGQGLNFKISKKLGQEMRPDSVSARQILLLANSPDADTAALRVRMDSIKTAIENGADFAEMAGKYSADLGSSRNGGDLGWFVERQPGYEPEFIQAAFGAKTGDLYVVRSRRLGYHLVEIQDQTQAREKVILATVERTVQASEETLDRIYNEASNFAITNSNLDAFNAGLEGDAVLNSKANEHTSIRKGAKVLGNLENPRQIIRWVYDNELGSVSTDPFESENQIVIVAVTGVTSKGTLPLEEVRDQVEEEVKKELKAEWIKNKIGSNTDLDAVVSSTGGRKEQNIAVTFNSFSIKGIGNEPAVLGTAFGLEQGQTSDPIAGNGGVYVIRVDSKTPNQNSADVEQLKNQIAGDYARRVDAEVFEALKEKGNVVDNRSDYY
ncbi:peptidylprolyl isomerase [bacterium SCSIO 12741]|nr:peptidylprolyl isomerase [bacterium SCSIO 12741]